MIRRMEHLSYQEKHREFGLFFLGKGRLQTDLIVAHKKDRKGLLQEHEETGQVGTLSN